MITHFTCLGSVIKCTIIVNVANSFCVDLRARSRPGDGPGVDLATRNVPQPQVQDAGDVQQVRRRRGVEASQGANL